jgi:hypothetical protein
MFGYPVKPEKRFGLVSGRPNEGVADQFSCK